MLATEWDWDEALAVSKEEGFEDGLELGVAYGKEEKQKEMIRAFQDVLSPEVIAEKIHVPVQYGSLAFHFQGFRSNVLNQQFFSVNNPVKARMQC